MSRAYISHYYRNLFVKLIVTTKLRKAREVFQLSRKEVDQKSEHESRPPIFMQRHISFALETNEPIERQCTFNNQLQKPISEVSQ
ncbi:hypothetical protein EYC84_002635 [Monilinia fructicola]|uniref:Uncharacterized protein n=1 Tax=Monilinia fructicola TaxID=38448 RepID=A0A5M9JU06_MONFR|nr:hypothetical protein EYC84_002635 [Monilinia fructicola]